MTDNLPVPADPDLTAPVRGATEQQMEFLRALASGDLTQIEAAHRVGVHYSTVHGWQKKNADLKERVEEIMRVRAMATLESLEPVLRRAATTGLVESWDEYTTIDAEGNEHNIRIHQKAPDMKAIALLVGKIHARFGNASGDVTSFSFDLSGARDKPELGSGEIEEGEIE